MLIARFLFISILRLWLKLVMVFSNKSSSKTNRSAEDSEVKFKNQTAARQSAVDFDRQ